MRIKRYGWQRDLPDFRDYGTDNPNLPQGFRSMLTELSSAVGSDIPIGVDLRPHATPVVDQGDLGSCTAHGVTAVAEYCERKAFGRYTPFSRLFLYKVTRSFAGLSGQGDTGAQIRNAMGAMALFGCPPEDYDPYNVAAYDVEPPAFAYALAANFKGLKYARVDTTGDSPTTRLAKLQNSLLRGWPWVFGFTCYESLDYTDAGGHIAFPKTTEQVVGGHCIAAMGFDTSVQCPNATKGAFLIKNSWGKSWGDAGYGWLPFDYFTRGLAEDCWVLTKQAWVDTGQFLN